MRTKLLTLAVWGAATPAFAHTDTSFHTHGAEFFVAVAAIGAAALLAVGFKK